MQGRAVWKELQLLLSLNLPDTAYYLWEGTATCCHCDDQRLVIGAPTEQSARQLVQAYLPVVRRTLQAIPDAPKRVQVVVTAGPQAHACLPSQLARFSPAASTEGGDSRCRSGGCAP